MTVCEVGPAVLGEPCPLCGVAMIGWRATHMTVWRCVVTGMPMVMELRAGWVGEWQCRACLDMWLGEVRAWPVEHAHVEGPGVACGVCEASRMLGGG